MDSERLESAGASSDAALVVDAFSPVLSAELFAEASSSGDADSLVGLEVVASDVAAADESAFSPASLPVACWLLAPRSGIPPAL